MTLLLPDTSSPRGAPAPQGGRPRYQRPLTRRGAPPPPSGPAAPLTSASVPSDHSPGRSSASPQPPPAPAAAPAGRRRQTGGPGPAFHLLLLLPRRSAPGLRNPGGWEPSSAEARRQGCQTRADCAPLSARRAGELQPQTAGGCGRPPACLPTRRGESRRRGALCPGTPGRGFKYPPWRTAKQATGFVDAADAS